MHGLGFRLYYAAFSAFLRLGDHCLRESIFWEGAIVILEETLGGRATISDECRRNNYEHYSFVFLTLYNIYIPLY